MRKPLWGLAALALSLGCSTNNNNNNNNNSSEITVALSSAAVTAIPGGTYLYTVTVTEDSGLDPAQLTLLGAPTGVTGTFSPNPTSDTAQLTLSVAASAALGDYTLQVKATASGLSSATNLTLHLRGPAQYLVVDHDASNNNDDSSQPTSASDTLFASTLTALGIQYDVLRVSSDTTTIPLTADAIQSYATLLWYTGSTSSGSPSLTNAEAILLDNYLQQSGARRVIFFSDALIFDVGAFDQGLSWTTATNSFVINDLGLQGAKPDVYDGDETIIAGADPSTAGLSLHVQGSGGPVATYYDALNPAAGTDTLLTLTDDNCTPDDDINSCTYPVGTGHTFGANLKKVIAVTFPVENIVNLGSDTQQNLIHDLLSY